MKGETMDSEVPASAAVPSSNGLHAPSVLPAETPGDAPSRWQRVLGALWMDDGQAAWREWRAYRLASAMALAVVILAVGVVIFVLRGQRVQVMVQVVQHDEQGRLVKIGVPMDLLAYEPQEGAVRDMLTDWIVRRHWRGDDASEVRARYDWRWLYVHTCGAARKQLAAAEKQEQPFTKSTRRVRVEVDSLPKTVDGYQVLWKRITTEPTQAEPKTEWWNTTFRVGRVMPATLADATLNNLGLCVTGFDDEPRHGLGTK